MKVVYQLEKLLWQKVGVVGCWLLVVGCWLKIILVRFSISLYGAGFFNSLLPIFKGGLIPIASLFQLGHRYTLSREGVKF